MKVCISSGHGKYVAGAEDILVEVEEARRVTDGIADSLEDLGVEVEVFHDDTSRDQQTNLETICNAHNESFDGEGHDWDISVHFNMSEGGTTDDPIGTEVWHKSESTKATAKDIASAIARVSGLKDRGPKQTDSLKFLNSTIAKACLLEICFVNSSADASLYERSVEPICRSIAETIAGEPETPERPERPSRPQWPDRPESVPVGDRPTLRQGDEGDDVLAMQRMIPRFTGEFDGDFGPTTHDNVVRYQRSRGLEADGICGPQTWQALYDHKLPEIPSLPPGSLTAEQQMKIMQIANESGIADYSWDDRGVAPTGWTQGMALAFGQTYKKLKAGHAAAAEMAKARTSSDKDALNLYRADFDRLGMSNESDGADTLRHLYALMLGHGMRESSGQHCCGRDQSADNVEAETCEAGAFQTSYNAHSASEPHFGSIMDEYAMGLSPGFLEAFSEGVSCSSSDWENYGSGVGEQFQAMCKEVPAFSAESCALTLRNLCNHYGPIIRHETELRSEADHMLMAVQSYVDESEPAMA